MKRCSAPPIFRQMQMKTTHLTPVRVAIIGTSLMVQWPRLCTPNAGDWVWSSTTSVVAQTVKCLPTMQETWVQSLGWEDLLQKEMATHSSIIAWKIPWMEEPGRLQSMGSQRVRHDWANSLTHSLTHSCRWHHPYGRKWRGTKEPVDESGRGEWKSWPKSLTFRKWRSWHLVPSLHGK